MRQGSTTFKQPSSTLPDNVNGKKWAGIKAIQDLIESKPSVIGIGSGTTIVHALEYLGKSPLAETVTCIPTSFQTRQLIVSNKLRLGSLEQYPVVDVMVDGVDEIDPDLNAIKGRRGCFFQEKFVAQASRKYVLIADVSKKSNQLGTVWKQGIPVEVMPVAASSIMITLEKMFPKANLNLRMAAPTHKVGPVVTDNGNFIIDCDFGPLKDPLELYKELKCISGVLDVGLFCKMADTAYIGNVDGNDGEVLNRKN